MCESEWCEEREGDCVIHFCELFLNKWQTSGELVECTCEKRGGEGFCGGEGLSAVEFGVEL